MATIIQPVPQLHTTALILAETWLWEQSQASLDTKTRMHRLRMWYIFMLLRYAGLRVVEILQLRHDALDCTNAFVRTGDRLVPIPKTIARRLKPLWNETLFASKDYPLACDSSTIRKAFHHCSEACGLPKGLLTARSLRRNRMQELCKQGLPLPIVNMFLGRKTIQDFSPQLDPTTALTLLYDHIHADQIMKTSARNVFQGRVESLKHQGILVQVHIQTAGGLKISALITDTSCNSLSLAPGVLVNASIKAPWVVILRSDQARFPENCYPGVVAQVRTDHTVTEVLVTLPEGSQVCCLQSYDPASPRIQEGDSILVYFKAFSVIVNLA